MNYWTVRFAIADEVFLQLRANKAGELTPPQLKSGLETTQTVTTGRKGELVHQDFHYNHEEICVLPLYGILRFSKV